LPLITASWHASSQPPHPTSAKTPRKCTRRCHGGVRPRQRGLAGHASRPPPLLTRRWFWRLCPLSEPLVGLCNQQQDLLGFGISSASVRQRSAPVGIGPPVIATARCVRRALFSEPRLPSDKGALSARRRREHPQRYLLRAPRKIAVARPAQIRFGVPR
jgi:hypothetical protein